MDSFRADPSLWALDIDHFPNEDKNIDGLIANVAPLAVVTTGRGMHVYFKKPSRKIIGNPKWSTGGYSGELRGDNGYVVLWEIDKLAVALDKLTGASPTSTTLFPKPPKATVPSGTPPPKNPNKTKAPDPPSVPSGTPVSDSGRAVAEGHRNIDLNDDVSERRNGARPTFQKSGTRGSRRA